MGGITYQAKDTEENKTKSEKYWRLKKSYQYKILHEKIDISLKRVNKDEDNTICHQQIHITRNTKPSSEKPK